MEADMDIPELPEHITTKVTANIIKRPKVIKVISLVFKFECIKRNNDKNTAQNKQTAELNFNFISYFFLLIVDKIIYDTH